MNLNKAIKFINPNENNYFFVDWFFGNKKNIQVNYEEKIFQNGTIDFPNLELVQNFIKIFRKYHGNRPINIKLMHGEIFIYKDHEELLQFCKDEGILLTITGTGSNNPNWWEKNVSKIGNVILDYHSVVDFNNFSKIVDILYQNSVFTIINVNVIPENFEFCEQIINKLTEKYTNFLIDYRVRFNDINRNILNYTDEQKQKIKKQAARNIGILPPLELHYNNGTKIYPTFNEMLLDKNYFKNWSCNIGIDQIVITHKGDIFKSWCGIERKIGTIYDETIVLPLDPVICNKERCYNGFDLLAEKNSV